MKVKLLHCFAFEQIFDDADKSELSCIIVDDIERLLGMAICPPERSWVTNQLPPFPSKKAKEKRQTIKMK